ncbi:MAG TPA: hypothetical protein VFV38_52330 [Ktedonobacteraceae bacterium]|nr:hypothetical protein [Ktedonobacteraceae bacterium]
MAQKNADLGERRTRMKGNLLMAGKQLPVVLSVFRTYLLQKRWSILNERAIQSGVQLLVTDGLTRVAIDCYTNGNALIQGAPGALKTDVQSWWEQQKASPDSPLLEKAAFSPPARSSVEALRAFAVKQRWSPAGRMLHDDIYQLRLTSEQGTVPIQVYPNGTILIQGNASPMRSLLERWWQQPSPQPPVGLWEQPLPGEEARGEKDESEKHLR